MAIRNEGKITDMTAVTSNKPTVKQNVKCLKSCCKRHSQIKSVL